MGNEGLEAFVVVSSQPINAVAAEAGTHGTEAVTVHIGFAGEVVNGRKVVLHTEAGVIAADFFEPLHAEAGQAPTVGGDDDVVVGGHDLEVPAIAPELAHG